MPLIQTTQKNNWYPISLSKNQTYWECITRWDATKQNQNKKENNKIQLLRSITISTKKSREMISNDWFPFKLWINLKTDSSLTLSKYIELMNITLVKELPRPKLSDKYLKEWGISTIFENVFLVSLGKSAYLSKERFCIYQ